MGTLPAIQGRYSEGEYRHHVQLLSCQGESSIYPNHRVFSASALMAWHNFLKVFKNRDVLPEPELRFLTNLNIVFDGFRLGKTTK